MLEILLWINGFILSLVLLLVVLFQLPAVQQFAAKKATVFLASKLKTKATIGRFTTDWKNSLVLKDFYLEAPNRDTLIYAGRLGLDLNILALTQKAILIRTARLENGVLNLSRTRTDSVFNIAFVKEAFGNGGTNESAPGNFLLKNLVLKNVRLNLRDEYNGNFVSARIGSFNGEGNPAGGIKNALELGNLKLTDSKITWRITQLADGTPDTAKTRFSYKKAEMERVFFDISNLPAARRFTAKIGKLVVAADKIALDDLRADLSKFTLENSDFHVYRLKQSSPDSAVYYQNKKVVSAKKATESKTWAVWLMKTKWQNISFNYTDLTEAPLPRGLDFNRLRLKKINVELSNVYYSQGRISGKLDQLQLLEKCGFRIKNFQAKVKAGPEFLDFSALRLQTNNSILRSGISADLGQGKKGAGLFNSFKVDLRNARFSPSDLLYLAPDLAHKAIFRKMGRNTFVVSGVVSGKIKDIYFHDFSLRGWTGTTLVFSGNLKNLQQPQLRQSNLKIRKLVTNKADLDLLYYNGQPETDFRFPQHLSLSGNLQTELDKMRFQQLNVSGSNGMVLQTSGEITGPENNKTTSLNVKKFSINRSGLLQLLQPGTVSPEVQLPENIQFEGTLQASSMENFAINGTFGTSFGNIFTDVKIRPVQQYSGHVSLDNFDLGKLLKQEKTLGLATGKADFEGKGYKLKTLQLHYKANVKKMVYNKDTYHNIQLEGSLNQNIYKMHGNLANAALQGLGHKLQKIIPKKLRLKKADPTQLIPKKIEPKKVIPKIFRKKKNKQQEEK